MAQALSRGGRGLGENNYLVVGIYFKKSKSELVDRMRFGSRISDMDWLLDRITEHWGYIGPTALVLAVLWLVWWNSRGRDDSDG